MMNATNAAAIEQIKRNLKSLRALARELDAREMWQEAEAINADADAIVEQIEAMELEAQDACEDHPALDRAA